MAGTSPAMTTERWFVDERGQAASTSTSSESSSAVILSRASSRIATPSRALTRTPLISTAPAAHHLHVARFSSALVAETVLMGDRAFADMGDDFHIGMRMGGKAGVWGDLVVVPHPQRAMAQIAGVVMAAE